jgi:ABC-2 type transport system ATP-binding protein
MAGLRVPTGGQISITVPGEPDQWATQRVLYASSHCNDGSMFKVEDFLQLYASMRPHWSQDHADRLLETFKLPRKRRLRSLSQGQFAAVEFIVAMASHAEVTLLDEVYLGMDAIYRDLMVQELVADFAEHPRTIIFATHYIEEFERMFDDVMIIDHARVVLHNDADELRKGGKSIKEVFLETVEKGAYDA